MLEYMAILCYNVHKLTIRTVSEDRRKRMKNTLVRQIIRFVGISGVGWLIDFALYTILTAALDLSVGYANFLSAIPAITFVFIISTRHTFVQNPAGFPLWSKYLIYVAYQLVLLLVVSFINQSLYDLMLRLLPNNASISALGPTITKALITPITLLCNFLVLRHITERM